MISKSINEICSSRQLLLQFTMRNIFQQNKGSALGMLWSILSPLLMFAVYAIVFGAIFNGRYNVVPNERGVDYAMGIFLSLTIFRFLADGINTAPVIIVGQPNFVKKVVFPLEILPMASVGNAMYNFMMSLFLLFAGMLIFNHSFTVTNLWFPVIIFPLFLLTMGLTWLFSALGVFFRDIARLMESVTLIIMYSSAVFFSTKMIHEKGAMSFGVFDFHIWNILKFNPLIHCIESSRRALLWDIPPHMPYLIYTYVIGGIVFVFGLWAFSKMKPAFADVL